MDLPSVDHAHEIRRFSLHSGRLSVVEHRIGVKRAVSARPNPAYVLFAVLDASAHLPVMPPADCAGMQKEAALPTAFPEGQTLRIAADYYASLRSVTAQRRKHLVAEGKQRNVSPNESGTLAQCA